MAAIRSGLSPAGVNAGEKRISPRQRGARRHGDGAAVDAGFLQANREHLYLAWAGAAAATMTAPGAAAPKAAKRRGARGNMCM